MERLSQEHLWCPIDLVLHVVGAKWTIPIVRELFTGPKRPSELSKTLRGINPKTLTDRLKDLEHWGLISRKAYQEIPPRVEYALTERGQDLVYVMEALRDLGESWQRSIDLTVPPYIKEQCTHCFSSKHEHVDGNGQSHSDHGKNVREK